MTLLWGLRRACPLVAVILLTFLLSFASAITVETTFHGVTFTEDSADNGLSGTTQFTVAWTSKTNGGSQNEFIIVYNGAIDSPNMIEGVSSVTSTL